MKQLIVTLVALVCFSTLNAQYKRASFFEKDGRTYAISGENHFMKEGKDNVTGITLSLGRDRDGRHFFSTTDFRLILPYKFSYETFSETDGEPLTITGKTKLQFGVGMNWGFFILKNTEEQLFKPFLTAGVNVFVSNGAKSVDNEEDEYNAVNRTAFGAFSTGIGGGAGTIIRLTNVIGVKLEGGYVLQGNIAIPYEDDHMFYTYKSHPHVSVGLRFRVATD